MTKKDGGKIKYRGERSVPMKTPSGPFSAIFDYEMLKEEEI